MKLEVKGSKNYSCEVVRITELKDIHGLDNLKAFSYGGFNALVSKDTPLNELALFFVAETQLSGDYVRSNNLYRKADLNENKEKTGYLDESRRLKAIKLRGEVSSALVMPLSSLLYLSTDIDLSELKEGDVFDTIDGFEICRKYELPKSVWVQKERQERKVASLGFIFPEHVDTENYLRNQFKFKDDESIVVTQKIHSTSGRFSHLKVKRNLSWLQKIGLKLGFKIPTFDYKYLAASRRVVKSVGNSEQHFYGKDVWSEVLEEIKHLIPKDTIIFGEIVGWSDENTKFQRNYAYNYPKGTKELIVYRVASIDDAGVLTDYSWKEVKLFCFTKGLKHVPELWVGLHKDFVPIADSFMNVKYYEKYKKDNSLYNEQPMSLDKESPCDEGVVIRTGGVTPKFYKMKSSNFLLHESKQLDSGDIDLESQES